MLIRRADEQHDLHQFPRDCAGAATAGHVSRHRRQADPRGEPARLSRRRGAGHGQGPRPRARPLRAAQARRGDGAGDRACPRRLRAWRTRCGDRRARRRAPRRRSGGGAHFPPSGRHAVQSRRAAGSARPRRDARPYRQRGAGRVLSRAGRRARIAAAMAAHGGLITEADLLGLQGNRIAAAHLRLSRLPHRVGAAAEQRRHDAVRNSQCPLGLGCRRGRVRVSACGASVGRGDAPCLLRPQQRPRRSGLCRQPGSADCSRPNMRRRSAPRSTPTRRPPPARSAR